MELATENIIQAKLSLLSSEQTKIELLHYLEYLLTLQDKKSPSIEKRPRFGSGKGTFVMADDFDAPLDDFKDYMP